MLYSAVDSHRVLAVRDDANTLLYYTVFACIVILYCYCNTCTAIRGFGGGIVSRNQKPGNSSRQFLTLYGYEGMLLYILISCIYANPCMIAVVFTVLHQ
jgi:hypothetical protein